MFLLGISRTHTIAVVLTKSVPDGLLGLEIDRILFPSSMRVSCLMPGCSSLKITCWVNLSQISMLPVSADIMYLKSYVSELIKEKWENLLSIGGYNGMCDDSPQWAVR